MLLFHFRFSGFPLLSGLISHAFLPVLCTWPSVSFFSSFPASLPQLFNRCFPSDPLHHFRFSSGLSPSFPLSFVRFFSGSDYSACVFSFPFIPASPYLGTSGADLSASLSACFHASVFALVLSLAALPFDSVCFASQRLPQFLTFPFGFRSFPLANTLGSVYLAWVIHPEN